ncbi:hypothetical protein OG599_03500 [Streptomyces sp. NBC_01335]|uniref:hypothetical protein n=1 Tax=Streptomyces sp. NBC_01335 TaxID=2903828 RepID=UPI002E156F15|nr:hypothetical protein OG599_03500 [Streptomyces sp. NBC_01335]
MPRRSLRRHQIRYVSQQGGDDDGEALGTSDGRPESLLGVVHRKEPRPHQSLPQPSAQLLPVRPREADQPVQGPLERGSIPGSGIHHGRDIDDQLRHRRRSGIERTRHGRGRQPLFVRLRPRYRFEEATEQLDGGSVMNGRQQIRRSRELCRHTA